MGMKRLQCLFIGPKSKLYVDFLGLLTELDLNIQVKQTSLKRTHIGYSLKKCREACLVVISDRANFSLGLLSDLVWQYSSDAIIVIVTDKTVTTSLKKPFNTTQIAKLFLEKESNEPSLFLQYLVQYAQLKADFRRCKRLLGVSEKGSRRLLDSSKDAIAYMSMDMHLYANTTYLSLFEINSIEDLQRTPVQDFVKKDERELYKNFINQQLRQPNLDCSLIISMKKANGLGFRASIQAVPTVFKGRKCLQLWAAPIGKSLSVSDVLESKIDNKQIKTGDRKKVERKLNNIKAEKEVSASSILRAILKRKDATISVQKLEVMNRRYPKSNHLLLSLKIKTSQKNAINNLLSQSKDSNSLEKQIVFWDTVKLTKLLQLLMNKKLDKKLYISLSSSAMKNKKFMEWLIKGVTKTGLKASNLVFLMPYEKTNSKHSFKYFKQLKAKGCEIAFDNFSVSTNHLIALKHYKPEHIRLSTAWVDSIMGDDSREVALGRLVRQFESKKIQVIAPCGLSKQTRRLFALCGASFCQEKKL